MTPPILFLIYNRPRLTERSFARVRAAAPRDLYLAADGPRQGDLEDERLCSEARAVVSEIDWDCDVHHLYRDHNLGLKAAVSSAITWFFEHVESGIILEDDCVAEPSFFRFCDVLLDRYEGVPQVMTVSGNNFQPRRRTDYSYYFSRYMHCWGWATWRGAWQSFDPDMADWPALRKSGLLGELFETSGAARYWTKIFDQVYAGNIDSWAYIWQYCVLANHGLNALPELNLVSNVGYGTGATHTKSRFSLKAERPTSAIDFPLRHPPFLIRHATSDRYTQLWYFQRPLHLKLASWARRIAMGSQ